MAAAFGLLPFFVEKEMSFILYFARLFAPLQAKQKTTNKNLMQNTIKKNTPPSKFGLKLTERALRRTMI